MRTVGELLDELVSIIGDNKKGKDTLCELAYLIGRLEGKAIVLDIKDKVREKRHKLGEARLK